jgi:hypothetical protein
MTIPHDIETALAARPDLLRDLRSTLNAVNSEKGFRLGFEARILNATEQTQLNTMLREIESSSISAARRGELIKATLELRGLGNLFAAPPDGK